MCCYSTSLNVLSSRVSNRKSQLTVPVKQTTRLMSALQQRTERHVNAVCDRYKAQLGFPTQAHQVKCLEFQPSIFTTLFVNKVFNSFEEDISGNRCSVRKEKCSCNAPCIQILIECSKLKCLQKITCEFWGMQPY